ncbi:MAG: alpha/beta fold hydrolase [Sulfitobacter sp.]
MSFQKTIVSVPQAHQSGQIEWPKGKPDAATDFVTLSNQPYADMPTFVSQIAKHDQNNTQETMLFVHGFNVRHAEAVYQLAQISHDFEIPSQTVLFSWPSAGVPAGYLYDRDSILIARDQLENVIRALTRQSGRKVTLLGHSMGNLLIMETLRQIEIGGDFDVEKKIGALIMISPDIDGELFYTQASRLKQLPQPAIIIAARQDKALRLSALLTGRTNRLGSQTDRSSVRDLPFTVIDATDLGGRGPNHDIALTSPAAISVLKNLDQRLLPGENQLPPLIDLGGLVRNAKPLLGEAR